MFLKNDLYKETYKIITILKIKILLILYIFFSLFIPLFKFTIDTAPNGGVHRARNRQRQRKI